MWEALGPTLQGIVPPPTEGVKLPPTHSREVPASPLGRPVEDDALRAETLPTFEWAPPDLTPGGHWHQTRVANLVKAAKSYGDRAEALVQEGMKMLNTHRGNYDATGPALKRLQLLWWEFPPEHWDAIREGSRMGFLSPPTGNLHSQLLHDPRAGESGWAVLRRTP